MIGWIALSCNAIVGEARRRRIVSNTVFAAFFCAKDAASSQASGIVPGIRSSSHKQAPRARVNVPEATISATAYANARMLE
jgi:hypothetical protein